MDVVVVGGGNAGFCAAHAALLPRDDGRPYYGYAVACGITFTFGGVRIDDSGRVLDGEGRHLPGLYAAGEMAGGLFSGNYPGGTGLTAGAVFGRAAGTAAATGG